VIGTAVKVFWELREELGHHPNRDQLRERVDQLRKQDGYPKTSERQWQRALKELSPYFRTDKIKSVKSAFLRRKNVRHILAEKCRLDREATRRRVAA
jgi:hypothetical protein